MDHNKLTYIQHFLLYDLEKLTKLDLSFNRISFIHTHALSHLKNLKELNLAGNHLATFDRGWLKGLHANMFEAGQFFHMLFNLIYFDCLKVTSGLVS